MESFETEQQVCSLLRASRDPYFRGSMSVIILAHLSHVQDVDGIKLSEQTHVGDPNFAEQQSDIKILALGSSILLGSQGDT